MNPSRIDAVRAALETERGRLMTELSELTVELPEPMTYGSQAAAATQVFDQQRVLALRERSQHQLEQIEAALSRLENGTFGRCQRCGKQIAEERLGALPWASHCIDCQRLLQHGRG